MTAILAIISRSARSPFGGHLSRVSGTPAHQVRALEPSIRITLTGFVFANHYEWDADMAR